MNFVGQLTEVFLDETIAISADDRNKVNVGTLAVSRHFSIKNIFATNDQPNYPDHDFAYTNAKIVPAGYLLVHEIGDQGVFRRGTRLKRKTPFLVSSAKQFLL